MLGNGQSQSGHNYSNKFGCVTQGPVAKLQSFEYLDIVIFIKQVYRVTSL